MLHHQTTFLSAIEQLICEYKQSWKEEFSKLKESTKTEGVQLVEDYKTMNEYISTLKTQLENLGEQYKQHNEEIKEMINNQCSFLDSNRNELELDYEKKQK